MLAQMALDADPVLVAARAHNPKIVKSPPFSVFRCGRGYAVALGHGAAALIDPASAERHRADVSLPDLSALASMGLPGGSWIIRVGRLVVADGAPIGRCPPVVADAIRDAMRREADAVAFEQRFPRGGLFSAGMPPASRRAPGTRHVGRSRVT